MIPDKNVHIAGLYPEGQIKELPLNKDKSINKDSH